MQLTVTTAADLVSVQVSGRFDAHGIADFDREVIPLIDAGHPHVTVDLSEVEFMDSSALAALVRTLKATVACEGSMRLAGVSDAARIILELTRLDAVFELAGSASTAVRR